MKRVKRVKAYYGMFVLLILLVGLGVGVYVIRNYSSLDPRSRASGASSDQIKYFGYYRFLGENFNGISDHATTLLLPTIEQIVRASTFNLNSVYIGTRFFWEPNPNDPGKLRLIAGWQNGWNWRLNQLISLGQSANILAIYIADEPDLFLTNPGDLQTVAQYVRQTLNDRGLQSIKLMTVLGPSGPERLYNQSFSLPDQIAWVGFNEYNCFADSECSGGISYQDKLDWIADYQKSRGKQVFVILNGISTPPPTDVYQRKINDYNRKIFGACLSRTNCVGVFTFFHDSQYASMYGSSSMPLIQNTLEFIGSKIKFMNLQDENLLGGNVAMSKPVSASRSHSSTSVASINDGNVNTFWNAGGSAPQWIKIDLQGLYTITGFKLMVSQSPPGVSNHKIYVAGSNGNFTQVSEYKSYTFDNDVIYDIYPELLTVGSGVRYVKVETVLSPSWISWREIQVFGRNQN